MNPWLTVLVLLICTYLLMRILAAVKAEPKSINGENPYLYPEKAMSSFEKEMQEYVARMPGKPKRMTGIYERICKRTIDSVLSFFGLVVLSPIFLALVIWIKLDDPGPVFFAQKRVGQGKTFFMLHKFRSMKMSTPHDMPTHMLENPDQYITRVGRFLRKSSLDELPQIWDIFRGKMSIIGPRPALWNQADLVAEREKYAANDVMPGLTGWAQINGRDELEIAEKARLDGEYVQKIGFGFDVKCFFGTILSVAKSDGIVEGGTGELKKQERAAQNGGKQSV